MFVDPSVETISTWQHHFPEVVRPTTTNTKWTTSRDALTLSRPSNIPLLHNAQLKSYLFAHDHGQLRPHHTLAQSKAIMADAVRLGTASAILHRYLETDRARPCPPRFRSRGPATCFSVSPHCESAAAVSARPHLLTEEHPPAREVIPTAPTPRLCGDTGTDIDW